MIWFLSPRRHSMSWAHNKSSPQRPHRGDYRRARPRHLDIVQLTQKIIKSRLSSRSVENLWINKIFDFSRIFFGLTLNHVILQNMNMLSTYLTISSWIFLIRLWGVASWGRSKVPDCGCSGSSPKWMVIAPRLNWFIETVETGWA